MVLCHASVMQLVNLLEMRAELQVAAPWQHASQVGACVCRRDRTLLPLGELMPSWARTQASSPAGVLHEGDKAASMAWLFQVWHIH